MASEHKAPTPERLVFPKIDIPTRKVRLAATQMACSTDRAANIDRAEQLVRKAAAKGANIILLQELFEAPYFCQEQRADLFDLAAPASVAENPLLRRFSALSAELNVVLPISFFERSHNAHYNSIIIFDAGRALGIYRKTHIPDGPGYTEKFYFTPGDTGFRVFETQFGKIGVGICWDQWFPECARSMALLGAEILFYPTAIGSEPHDSSINSREHWQRVMQGHAGANVMPLVASNRIGKEKDITFYGHSFIAGPHGEMVVESNDKDEDIIVADFDLEDTRRLRTSWGVFRDRRPEHYTALMSSDGRAASTVALQALGAGVVHPAQGNASLPFAASAYPLINGSGTASASSSSFSSSSVALASSRPCLEQESLPAVDGFRMPAEWEQHERCWMLWPYRQGTWRDHAKFAQAAFTQVASVLSQYEPVTMCVPSAFYSTARAMLPSRVTVVEMASDDSWMRDIGPTFLVGHTGEVRGVDWEFNSWGGKVDGCYPNWEQDTPVKRKVLELAGASRYYCPIVLEGGSIHSDGQGTILTTEECLLNPNRLKEGEKGPRTKAGMEAVLRDYVGAQKVIWLPRGLYGDRDTNGHIDNIACFVRPGEVALSWCDDEADPQYEISQEAYRVLTSSTDARGRPLRVHKIHVPRPMYMTKEEVEGLLGHEDAKAAAAAEPAAAAGEITFGRKEGERLAASYVNYYVGNGCVILPGFGDEIYDAKAKEAIQALYPDRTVHQIPSREIVLGGGNIHCITQNQPRRA